MAQMRNAILLSHSGAGKTSLTEALLLATGCISRLGKVEQGTTTSDFDPEEIKRRISINLSLLPMPWKDTKINLLDAPGYADFYGEVRAGLSVVEGALLVVCAASGVEVGTEQMWHLLNEQRRPRLVFINKMDRENASFSRTLNDLNVKLGGNFVPLHLPIGAASSFEGLVDLISNQAYSGSQGKSAEIPGELKAEADALREKLVEAAIESDDELLASYLEGQEIAKEGIDRCIREGVRSGRLVPVLAGSALRNMGITQLLEAITTYLPSPQDAGPLSATQQGSGQASKIEPSAQSPLAALVFKTVVDPYVGKLSYFRVFSGTLASNSQLWNTSKGAGERIGQLFSVRGKTQEAITQVVAGDMGAVAKLAVTATGDTLGSREHPFTLPTPRWPSPVISLALHPKTKADLDKMGSILPRLLEEDPSLRLQREQDTGEILLSGQGETHLEVAVERIQRKFGVDIKLEVPRVPYKETIRQPVKTEYRHKKQTGGHGQFAHVFLELAPLPRGTGVEFSNKIVGGAISKNYIPAVEKGIHEAAKEGVVAGYPVVDVKATLYDGKEHPVDSSDVCFKIAGSYAFKRGLEEGGPLLLEPIIKLQVEVPEAFTGSIIADLNTKRAHVLGMNPGGGRSIIEALVPLSEVQRYATELRSLTQNRGTFSLEFSHYEEVPAHLTPKIAASRQRATTPS